MLNPYACTFWCGKKSVPLPIFSDRSLKQRTGKIHCGKKILKCADVTVHGKSEGGAAELKIILEVSKYPK